MTDANLILIIMAAALVHVAADAPMHAAAAVARRDGRAFVRYFVFEHAAGARHLLHALAVLAITGSPLLGIAELSVQVATEWGRRAGELSMAVQMGIQVLCKAVWLGFVAVGAIHLHPVGL